MSKTKTEKTPLELLVKAFEEDVNDKELQLRYDGFLRRLDEAKENYNQLVPVINELIRKKGVLHSSIFSLAIEGIISTEANQEYKKIREEYDELEKEVVRLKNAMEEVEDLIKKYKDGSHSKLFAWWKSFKAIDPKGTKPWTEWKRPYENLIR
jgi:chromosome segregation ATPase